MSPVGVLPILEFNAYLVLIYTAKTKLYAL